MTECCATEPAARFTADVTSDATPTAGSEPNDDSDTSLILNSSDGTHGHQQVPDRDASKKWSQKLRSMWTRVTSSASSKRCSDYFPRNKNDNDEALLLGDEPDGDVRSRCVTSRVKTVTKNAEPRCFADIVTSVNDRRVLDLVQEYFLQQEALHNLHPHSDAAEKSSDDVITVKILRAAEFQTMFRSFDQFNASGVTVTSSTRSGTPDYFLSARNQCVPGVTFSYSRLQVGRLQLVFLRKFKMRNISAFFVKNITPDSLMRLAFYPDEPSKSRIGRKLKVATISGQLMLVPKFQH